MRSAAALPAGDARNRLPRFRTAAKGATAAQVARAWVHARTEHLGVPVLPIPGTKRVKWLELNVAAEGITLSPDDIAEPDGQAARTVGGRY